MVVETRRRPHQKLGRHHHHPLRLKNNKGDTMTDEKRTFVVPNNVKSDNFGINPPPPSNQVRPAPPPPPPKKQGN